jgi:small-conductance mechanosensitive channel
MPPSNIATAADYADAMMIARRAKNTLFLLLMAMLALQMVTFFVARLTNHVLPAPADTSLASTVSPTTAPSPTTQGSAAAASPAETGDHTTTLAGQVLRYVTALIDFLGILLIIVLAMVILLIAKIMLVGRLIGVAQVTSAFIWCVVLVVLLFPWQAFLQNTDFTGDFKIPGVLYTWSELTHPTLGAKFQGLDPYQTALRWTRFVGAPVVAMILLLVVQAKSSRGLRAALGESELESSAGDLQIP